MAIVAAIYFLVRAFFSLHRKRTIEDTPTSLLRSAPQGYTELVGRGIHIDGPPVISPLSREECLWYRMTCEEMSNRNKYLDYLPDGISGMVNLLSRGSHAHNMNIEESDDLFYLDDNTGRCVIDPEGAKITPSLVQTWYGNSPVPDRGPALSGSAFGSRYRYKEELLLPGQILYAIGDLESIGRMRTGIEIEGEVVEILHEWKADQESLLENFDLNNDGEINILEWNKARRRAKQEVAEKHKLNEPDPIFNIMRDPHVSRRPYLISSKRLPDLVKRYHYKSVIFFVMSLLTSGLITYAITFRL